MRGFGLSRWGVEEGCWCLGCNVKMEYLLVQPSRSFANHCAELKFILSCCYLFFALLSVCKTFYLSRNLVKVLAVVKQLKEWCLPCYSVTLRPHDSSVILYCRVFCILLEDYVAHLFSSFDFVGQC